METMLNLRDIPVLSLSDMAQVRFARNEMLLSMDDRRACRTNLDKAAVLGNSETHKTRIVFATLSGYRQILCAVLAVNDKGVEIEGRHSMPMESIYNVEIVPAAMPKK